MASPPPPEKPRITATDLRNKKFVREVRANISSDVLVITEDKVRLVLIENQEQSLKQRSWQTPLGILATLLTVLVTTRPVSAFGLSGSDWRAVGVVATVVTAGWLGRTAWATARAYRSGAGTIEGIVARLKEGAAEQQNENP